MKFGITCDGYDRQSRTPSPRSHSQGLAPTTGTRTPSLPSIPTAPSSTNLETDENRRYFNTFRDRTTFHLTPFFDSDSFRILVLQSCSVPAIRHIVVAIGALAKACMTFHEEKEKQPGRYVLDHRRHHGAAITEYSKALGLMREASIQGCQNLRTTLVTSLLIACFECCHGNYALADAQVESAIGLMNNWRYSCPSADPVVSSPAPDVVDDRLICMFGGLEIQSNLFGAKNTADQHRVMMYEGEDVVQKMPAYFDNLDIARAYLQLIVRRLIHWMCSVDQSHDTDTEADAHTNTNVQYQKDFMQEQFLHDLVSDSSINSSTYQFEYIHHRSQLDQWNNAFSSLLEQSPFLQDEVAVTLLQLGSRSCLLLLNTIIGQENVSLEEDTMNITRIIQDSNLVVDRLRNRSNSHFVVLQGMLDPTRLAEVLNSRSRHGRIEAIRMLFRWPRSEGRSNSLFLGRTLHCVPMTDGYESDRQY